MPQEREPESRSRPKPVAVTVAVASDHLGQFDDVVERCKQAGLKVDQALKTIGVIYGTIAPSKMEDLQKVEGVDTVEEAASYQIPPPDSPVQ